ncbi:DUF4040 domain-containing protein [Rickettsiales bacterium]|nr:DUF4040 domain-containing protein [Rickettsiales bacterium]
MTLELILNFVVLFLLLITAIAVVRTRNLLPATILLSAFSLLMATQYLILGAPDVAITEAAVGAGISTILLLLALFMVGDKEEKSKEKSIIPAIVVCFVAVSLIYVVIDMPAVGDPNSPASLYLSPYYIEKSASEIGIPNIVTSILASYRGYDTFGETIVIFTAAVAILMLLGKSGNKGRKS